MTTHICIYSFYKDEFLDKCIESIRGSSGFTKRFVDLYVFSEDIALDHPYKPAVGFEVTLLRDQKNFSWITNRSIEKARRYGHELFLLLNSDTVLHPDCLSLLEEKILSDNQIGVIGGYQTRFEGGWNEPNRWTESMLGGTKESEGADLFYPTDYVQGACMLFRTPIIESIGFFDERFELFYEETEFCRRVIKSGFKVGILKSAKVKHYGGGTWKKTGRFLQKRDILYLSNQILFEAIDGAKKPLVLAKDIIEVMKKQIRQVKRNEDQISISLFYYPLVLLSLLKRWTLVRDMYRYRGVTRR